MTEVIRTTNLKKNFYIGENTISALKGVNLTIGEGEFLIVFGPSGCGKTTLLSLLAGLDSPAEGTVEVRGADIYRLKPDELARYRRTKIGIVFQQFNLVPSLSALDNVSLPLILSGISRHDAHKRAGELLATVGMSERLYHRPTELSGGQQQRVAIARALAANPQILLIDEPTGNLDIPTGNEVMEILKNINKDWGRTIILVTHNPDFKKYGDRVVYMEDGEIVKEEKSQKGSSAASSEGVNYYVPKKSGSLRLTEMLRLAKIHFWNKKLRTFLTILGVTLGVGSIVTLVSLGIGLQKITSSQLASLDSLVTITVSTKENSVHVLNDEAIKTIEGIDGIALISPALTLPAQVSFEDSTSQVIAQGLNPEALAFEGVKLVAGGDYTDEEGIVISTAAAKNFNISDYQSAIGKKINLEIVVVPGANSEDLEIKTYKLKKEISGISSDDLISSAYLSLKTVQSITGRDDYSSLKVKASDRRQVVAVRDNIEKLGYATTSVVDLIRQVDKIFLITQIVLGIIGGVALIVALIGIVNIMTISLLERTHEVGIMKAVGATNHDIRRIFEYEVILFGLFGSIGGVAVAIFFGQSINFLIATLMRLSEVPGTLTVFVTPFYFALEMIVLTVFVSLLAGLFPAKRASRLSPMEALRYE